MSSSRRSPRSRDSRPVEASTLNISAVARECSVERKVVEDYFAILEDLFLAIRIPVFTKRAKRRLAAHPKFFLFDAGVFRAIRPRGPLDGPEEIDGAAIETLFLPSLGSAIGDFDGDGRADIAGAIGELTGAGAPRVWYGTPGGSLRRGADLVDPTRPKGAGLLRLAVADLTASMTSWPPRRREPSSCTGAVRPGSARRGRSREPRRTRPS